MVCQCLIIPCVPAHRDTLNGTTHLTKEVLAEAGFKDVTDHDIIVCQHVAAVVGHRAALLVAIPTSVLLTRLTCPDITIAIDGSVYKNHPRMDAWLNRIISKLNSTKKIVSKFNRFFSLLEIQRKKMCQNMKIQMIFFCEEKGFNALTSDLIQNFFHLQFRLMLAEDGSGKGACLTAAIALKLDKQLIQ